jgi:hypothetical protein
MAGLLPSHTLFPDMSDNPESRTLMFLRAIRRAYVFKRFTYALLTSEPAASVTRISNAGAINTMRELLSQEDYVKITPHIKDASDAGNLMDFILSLLRNELLSNGELKENRRARRLLLKIASETSIIPRSLFVKEVIKKVTISRGGFGLVVKGESGGAFVALTFLYKNVHHNSVVSCPWISTPRSI